MSPAKARRGVSDDTKAATQPQSAAMPSPFPPIADYAFLSDCHTDALVAPGTCPNMTMIVSDGKDTCCCWS